MKFETVSWDEVERMCESLCVGLAGIDVIVGIARGGLVPSRIISDILGVDELYTIRIKFYLAPGRRMDRPVVLQGIRRKNVYGKRVLVVDDISDSGASFGEAIRYLNSLGVKSTLSLSLHMKSGTEFVPDRCFGLTDSWIVYPWERRETKRMNVGL